MGEKGMRERKEGGNIVQWENMDWGRRCQVKGEGGREGTAKYDKVIIGLCFNRER